MAVSIYPCDGYDQEEVYQAMKALLAPLGGMEAFVRPGMKVYIKPNLLRAAHPGEAVTTHPEVVGAVARLVREAGGEGLVGDCPGGGSPERDVMAVYQKTGIQDVARREGARLVVNTHRTDFSLPEGGTLQLSEEMLSADALINIGKIKTHMYAGYTGAVKNLFGAVIGTRKAQYHAQYPRVHDFSGLLIDIAQAVKPCLNIMDGVWAMEGPGPSAGKPRKLGALVAGADPYSVDVACLKLMAWNPDKIETIRVSQKHGLLPQNLEEIEIVGGDISSINTRPFQPASRSSVFLIAAKWLLPGLIRDHRLKPLINRQKCISCGKCSRECPVKAIRMADEKPNIDYQLCISCFCCQELCPADSVSTTRRSIK